MTSNLFEISLIGWWNLSKQLQIKRLKPTFPQLAILLMRLVLLSNLFDSKSANMQYTHITVNAGAAAKIYQVIWNNKKNIRKFLSISWIFIVFFSILTSTWNILTWNKKITINLKFTFLGRLGNWSVRTASKIQFIKYICPQQDVWKGFFLGSIRPERG